MTYKAGFIGLIGIPNAGKSTLVNALVGEKVSIVSKKPQTTRKRITGIYSDPEMQAVFVDAPGVIKSDKGLNSFLIDEYKDVIRESDALLAILNMDVKSPQPLEEIIEICKSSRKPFCAIITKQDLGMGHRALVIKTKLENLNIPYVEVTALKNPEQTRSKVKKLLYNLLPDSPAPLYEDDIYTTEQTRYLVGEMIREKCFELLYEEIPYDTAVLVRAYEEFPNVTKIHADIIVDKESQRKIIIGLKGAMLKAIGSEARVDIEKMLGRKVYLELHITVKKNWLKSPSLMKELGYVVAK